MTEKERELLLEIAYLLSLSDQTRKLFEATGVPSYRVDTIRSKSYAVNAERETTKANMNHGS